MKGKLNKSSFLLGVLTTLLVVCLATPAMAAAMKTIEVFTGVKIYIDDKELNPTDPNGNPVDVFIYDGTTYLPVRAVSEAVGKAVQWDGATRSVYLGKHSSDTPAAYLSQLDYFTQRYSWTVDKLSKDNLGNEHAHSIRSGSSNNFITYKLNGQYSRLTALYYQRYDCRSYDEGKTCTLVISGDGREIWRGAVGAGMDPVNIDIDISGVLELTLEYPSGSGNNPQHTTLGEVALWS